MPDTFKTIQGIVEFSQNHAMHLVDDETDGQPSLEDVLEYYVGRRVRIVVHDLGPAKVDDAQALAYQASRIDELQRRVKALERGDRS